MKQIFFTFLLFLCVTLATKAQSTFLKVYSQEDSSEIDYTINPKIKFLGNNQILLKMDSLAVKVSSVGYKSESLKLIKGKENIVYLKPSLNNLDEDIVIYGSLPYKNTLQPKAFLYKSTLEKTSNISLVNALNTEPGIRMEERSPGSYRLAIRGSSIRSPFGVRNVRVYLNDLPFTDASGNTYLNQLENNNIEKLSVQKGPNNSIFGSGIGGVINIDNNFTPNFNRVEFFDSPNNTLFPKKNIESNTTIGSFGLLMWNLKGLVQSEKQSYQLSYTNSQQDGYRDHSAMKRQSFDFQSVFIEKNKQLTINFLYSDLFYQTPGALTLAQYNANPRQARPAAGPFNSAQTQKASISNQTYWLSISQNTKINIRKTLIKNHTGIYVAHNNISNPSVRNYEKRSEPNIGGRTCTNIFFRKNNFVFSSDIGAELQYGFFNSKTFGNQKGNIDTLQLNDEVKAFNASIFAQTELTYHHNWRLNIGLSHNSVDYKTNRFGKNQTSYNSNFKPVLMPRITLAKALKGGLFHYNTTLLYINISQGYSAPTVAEIIPSQGIYNANLVPEKATNYEIGSQIFLFKGKLKIENNLYIMNLNNTIVLRKTEQNGDYFINYGKTLQKGLETSINYRVTSKLKFWASGTFNDFRFKENNNITNNKLTGTPNNTVVAGIDYTPKKGMYGLLNFNFTDKIPLNDFNTVKAKSYKLLGIKTGYKNKVKQWSYDIAFGVDNLLNEKYSLGNDLNADRERFYNAAPTINYYSTIKVGYLFSKK